jgi:glycosyltransferase involved in cell wall biosynthesis
MHSGYNAGTTRKIGYIMLGDTDKVLASTRITILNTLDLIRQNGYDPMILDKSSFYDPFRNLNGVVEEAVSQGFGDGDIVYIQSMRSESAIDSVNKFRGLGIKTVFGVCNFIDTTMAGLCDATVVPSQRLKGCYPEYLHDKIHVVHDGIEFSNIYKTNYGVECNPCSVFLTGKRYDYIPGLFIPEDMNLTVIGPYGHNNAQSFRVPRGHGGKTGVETPKGFNSFRKIVWSLEAYKRLSEFDIGVLPIDLNEPMPRPDQAPTTTRSSNKLTQMMSVGLPVIAGPLPAYYDIIEHGVNGFIATTPDEWITAFDELRSADVRIMIGKVARESVKDKFSLEAQVDKLLTVLKSL